jgi:hypothetical protein
VREWLHTLGRFNVPCALVSSLDRTTVQVSDFHEHRVPQERQLLSSTRRVARCVITDSPPCRPARLHAHPHPHQAALARMGLHDHFSAIVTAEDEVETIAQRLLTGVCVCVCVCVNVT